MSVPVLVAGDPPLAIEPLRVEHIDAVAAVLRKEAVYRHIGGEPPTMERYRLGMERALQGPPAERARAGERWVNHLVRDAATGHVLGRLEATVRPPIAEVAFLFDPTLWGRGVATRGLQWLHAWLRAECGPLTLWATTLPANTRSQRLLERCGYTQVDPAEGARLLSYDDGDLVYRLQAPAQESPAFALR